MGRSPCSEQEHTNKGAWTKEEDERLINYINIHGEGNWQSVPKAAGLLRSWQSCLIRWTNYLRIDIKRSKFTELEDALIIELHGVIGNKWSVIAARLPGRTKYEIENYWNIYLERELYHRGLDPQTHRPFNAPTATATDPVSVVNINNNNDGSNNNNNCKFQELELEQYISRTQASSLNTESVRQQNSDVSANSISESTNFSIWEKRETIGAGGHGIVYVAHNRETGDLCAVKELKDIHKLENIQSIQKEIKVLSQLEHTNVVKYYGHEIVGRRISLYMEYIRPGSLKKYILKKLKHRVLSEPMLDEGVLSEPLIRNFTAQILSGLVYLHSERVVHRDIKPDNLLVDSNNNVKLGDFGLAKHLAESVGNHSILGTLYYAAPEVLQKTEYKSSVEDSAADIWSLGCVIIEMFSGEHPWPDCEPLQAAFKVVNGKEQPPIPEKLCEEGKDFLKLCFTRNPADRPSASALLDHPFVKPQTTSLADGRKYN